MLLNEKRQSFNLIQMSLNPYESLLTFRHSKNSSVVQYSSFYSESSLAICLHTEVEGLICIPSSFLLLERVQLG